MPLLAIAPGLTLTIAVLAINFVGDGLRDALDPRGRGLSAKGANYVNPRDEGSRSSFPGGKDEIPLDGSE